MKTETDPVNFVKSRGNKTNRNSHHMSDNKKCYRCDKYGHISTDTTCPAKDKECNKCHKVGHIAKCCKSKQKKDRNFKRQSARNKVNLVNRSDSGEEYAFSVNNGNQVSNMISVSIGGIPTHMIIDSGASCNLISRNEWERLKSEKVLCESRKCSRKLFAYGSKEPLEITGSFKAEVSIGMSTEKAEFIVVEGQGQNLLGKETAVKLNVLRLGPDLVNNISGKDFREQYKEVFTGLGKLKNFQLQIPIDKSVKPIAQNVRPVPFSLREKIEKKLEELLEMDIIERAEGPTPWVSQIVAAPKPNGDIRLCVDMRQANSAILRERHPIPTVDEVLQNLNCSKVFSKLDLNLAFHQIELSEESRSITTFVTHKGLFRYKRLMFGISCAPEMYQRIIFQTLQGCTGVRNIFDDIVVHGATKEDHDRNLEGLLQRLSEKGLTLNFNKCQFNLSEIDFMGHLLTAREIGPEKTKIEAITEARRPETASEIRSFLGLVNFCARFIPDLATLTEPLRRLTKQGAKFDWDVDQENAFKTLKKKLTNAETLGYFDTEAKTQLITDPSPVGLGAVLTQIQHG